MRSLLMAVSGVILAVLPAVAQEKDDKSPALSGGPASGMAGLLAKGYEIKAAVPNGTRYIVFLQKDQSAYACEFVSLTKSRCGSIN
jgi:hypothetical protein